MPNSTDEIISDNKQNRAPATSQNIKLMLAFLLSGFVLSQAYRTLGGILSVPLREEFSLSSEQLATIIGAFHVAFGCLQLLMGILIDCFGIRRTILAIAPFSILGAFISALATTPSMLLIGQALLGIGCSPAFLVCMVLIAQRFPPMKFAPMYAIALGSGSLGLIFTSTPTAWLSDHYGWRTCFYLLGTVSILSWLTIFFGVRGVDSTDTHRNNTFIDNIALVFKATLGYIALLKNKETIGVLSLLFVNYAAFITLRGLWLGPLLVERHEQSLVFAGNLALILSIISIFSPSLFGRLDPGTGKRYPYLAIVPWFMVVGFITLSFSQNLWLSVTCTILIAILNSNSVWQLADAKDIYPAEMRGRALAMCNTSMFLGIAFMQSVSGQSKYPLPIKGVDIYSPIFLICAFIMAIGILLYTLIRKR